MKTRLPLSSVLLLVLFLEMVLASPADAVIRIMPIGDSITQGYASGVNEEDYMISYRYDLWDLLDGAGYDVDFVGGQDGGWLVFDEFQHEGHHGWTADEILNGNTDEPEEGMLIDWLRTHQPEIILLHIGTNDINSGQNPNGVVSEVSQILDKIDEYEITSGRYVWVILARIINRIPSSSTITINQAITQFNIALYDMAFDRTTNPANPAYPDKIKIVNMETGAGIVYDYYYADPPGDMYDQIHPYTFGAGYEKMANVWFSGLQDIVPDNCPYDPEKIEPGVCGCGVADTDSDGDGMPDCWEKEYGLDPFIDDAYEDLDGDGFTNIIEYTRGTDPSDPNSRPSNAMPWIPLLLLDD